VLLVLASVDGKLSCIPEKLSGSADYHRVRLFRRFHNRPAIVTFLGNTRPTTRTMFLIGERLIRINHPTAPVAEFNRPQRHADYPSDYGDHKDHENQVFDR
jgi:hypothetical protein